MLEESKNSETWWLPASEAVTHSEIRGGWSRSLIFFIKNPPNQADKINKNLILQGLKPTI